MAAKRKSRRLISEKPVTRARGEVQRMQAELRRRRWNISPRLKARCVKRLWDIVNEPKTNPRAVARAIGIIATLEAQCQADQHLSVKFGRLDAGDITERADVHHHIEPVYGEYPAGFTPPQIAKRKNEGNADAGKGVSQ